jgi:hypothetical protein
MVKRKRAGCAAEITERAAGGRRSRARLALVAGCATILVGQVVGPGLGMAQQAQTLDEAPVQVQPTALEPGVPAITVSVGTPNPFPGNGGAGTGTGSGTGDGTGGGDGTGLGGSGSGGTSAGGSTSLSTMLSTPWGASATANAQSVGINPSALAATCVLESGCNTNAPSNGGAKGTFQMYPAAFSDGLKTALAANPGLASQVVQGPNGVNDPTTAAIAASGYLLQSVSALQNAGISNPTILDSRAYYMFGPTYGPQVATAQTTEPLSTFVPQSWLAQNGLSSSTTVGQWQATVSAKAGSAASQVVHS